MKVFELKKRKSLKHAIQAIALVENPAIEEDFIYLSIEGKKAKSNIFLAEEKGIIYSPVLIPEQRIKRVTDSGEVYEIFFSKETIEEAAHDMMKAKTPLSEFNEEHTDKVINQTNVVELWIVDDPKQDKATKLGFDVVAGTLMAGIKVDDEETRQKIKDKKIKGISIEGLFEDFELVEESTHLNNQIMNKLEKTVDELVTKLKSIVPTSTPKLTSIQVDENTILYTEGDFSEGVMVYTDEAMTVPAIGEYTVEGRKLTIAEGGSLVSIEEAAAPEEMSTELAEAQAKATLALNEKVTALEKENAELKEVNATFKTELSTVKELAGKNAVLLAKVEAAESQSLITKLSKEDTSKLTNLKKFNIV